jgi:hypothetical protein
VTRDTETGERPPRAPAAPTGSHAARNSRSTSCFELAWDKEQPARRAYAAPAPRDGHTDVGKLAAYHSSMNSTVVCVVLLFFLEAVADTHGKHLQRLGAGAAGAVGGCGRWLGPAGLLSRLAP